MEKQYKKANPVIATLQLVDKPLGSFNDGFLKSFADFGHVDIKTPDLRYLQGILVTSGMNSNRDVMLPSEMLKSFANARYKPIDVEHKIEENVSIVKLLESSSSIPIQTNTNTIIGSIYDVALVRERDGARLLASDLKDEAKVAAFNLANMDEHPLNPNNKYHIIIAAVLWKFLFPQTIHDITEKINAKEMALSMESWFLDYDYLVDNEVRSSYEHPELEKFYKDRLTLGSHPVGRVLRHVLWGGGGVVGNPANVYGFDYIQVTANTDKVEKERKYATASIVTTKKEETDTALGGGGIEKQTEPKNKGEKFKMENIEKELGKLTASLEKFQTENSELRSQLAVANNKIKDFEAATNVSVARIKELELETKASAEKIAGLEKVKTELETAKASAVTELESVKKAVAEKETKVTELTKSVADLTPFRERAEKAEASLAKIADAAVLNDRKAKFTEAGVFLEDRDTDESLGKYTEETFASELETRKAVASKNKGVTIPFLEINKGTKDAMRTVASSTKGSDSKGNKKNPFEFLP